MTWNHIQAPAPPRRAAPGKISVRASVGPAELNVGHTYVHEVALEGDENLTLGMPVEVIDDAERHFAGTVTGHDGHWWQLTLQP
jgi:hypothetical protein